MSKKYFLKRTFHFDAAHQVTDYNGKCENLHGHTYILTVTITGEKQENGMVLDFAILKKIVNEVVLAKLDHKFLNDLFENPTTENIATYIFDTLNEVFKKYRCSVYEISLSEGINNTAVIRDV
jgi:6-pyruvoyltetrahydropterin/6-carboxytetrahydropterin synthase